MWIDEEDEDEKENWMKGDGDVMIQRTVAKVDGLEMDLEEVRALEIEHRRT